MTIREEFEKRFPVPEGAVFFKNADGTFLGYGFDLLNGIGNQRDIRDYDNKWIGFQAGAKHKQCIWVYDEYEDGWDTGCGNKFSFVDGKPTENKFAYCCFCGGELVEAKESKDA